MMVQFCDKFGIVKTCCRNYDEKQKLLDLPSEGKDRLVPNENYINGDRGDTLTSKSKKKKKYRN